MFCSSGCCMCPLLLGCCQCKAVNSPAVAELQVGRYCSPGRKTWRESSYLGHAADVIFVIQCRCCITLQLAVSESYRDFPASPSMVNIQISSVSAMQPFSSSSACCFLSFLMGSSCWCGNCWILDELCPTEVKFAMSFPRVPSTRRSDCPGACDSPKGAVASTATRSK